MLKEKHNWLKLGLIFSPPPPHPPPKLNAVKLGKFTLREL